MTTSIQNIFVAGSISQLGNWDPASAVRLLIPVNEFVEFVELTYWDEP